MVMDISFSVVAIKTKQVVIIVLIIGFYLSLVLNKILIAPCKFSLLITFVQQVLQDRWSLVSRPVHKNLFLEFPKNPGSFMLHFDR